MGYQHIENLYRPKGQRVLAFKRVYAMEKVHGTSAHVAWRSGRMQLHPGGAKTAHFEEFFRRHAPDLQERLAALGYDDLVVHGEAYGGSCQRMRGTYGDELRFIAFDARVGESWLAVPQMADLCERLGLEVVPWVEVDCALPTLDALRDAPSEIAVRRGCGGDQHREGIVIRPPFEVVANDGLRVVAKHKRDEFRETATQRPVVDPSQLTVLTEANAVATEWVTDERLRHVLQRFDEGSLSERSTGEVILAVSADVLRESEGEVAWSRSVDRAVKSRAATLFWAWLREADSAAV